MSGAAAATGTTLAAGAAVGAEAGADLFAGATIATEVAGAASSFALPSLATLGSIATAGIGLAGIGAKAYGQEVTAQGQSQAAAYNAAVMANNATIATQSATLAGHEGAANTAIQQAKTRSEVGSILASQGANGVDINSGSNVDVRSTAAETGQLNAISIRSNAARQAYGYETEAASDKAQQKLDEQQSGYAAEGGNISATGTLLSGAAQGAQSGLWDSFLDSNSLNGT